MNIKYSEDPKAWRRSTFFTLLALAVLSLFMRWRRVLAGATSGECLALLAAIAIVAWLRPSWFRTFYRFSTWAGFWSSQCVARLVLAIIFALIIVPAAFVLRILGKDPLHLKFSKKATSYWRPAKPSGSLDRLF